MIRKIISVFLAVLCVTGSFECRAIGVSASSAIVIDKMTGEVIYEKNARQRRSMASTTKIMTAICALENGNPEDMVKVHPKAVGVEGSSMYLGHGETVSLSDLVYGLMLASGNDAAVAIAMHISGSVEAFAELMNETARKIGVKDTNFKNPNGLDAQDHYTTAADLAAITRYAMSDKSFCDIVSTWSKKIPWQGRDYDRQLKNHNKLLKMYEGCDGVKTGFTKKSGRCLVSSATREGFQVIAVTLNAPDDWNDHISMLNYAFDNYECKPVLKVGEYVRGVQAVNGACDIVKAVTEKGFDIPVKNGSQPDVEIKYNIADKVEAPVNFGDSLGNAEIYYKGSLIGSVEIVSASSCARVEPKTYIRSISKILRAYFLMYRRTC